MKFLLTSCDDDTTREVEVPDNLVVKMKVKKVKTKSVVKGGRKNSKKPVKRNQTAKPLCMA